jgi:hypothetical protein
MRGLKKEVIWAMVLVVFIAFVLPVAVSAGGATESRRIWVHFNPRYFVEGNNLPVFDQAGKQVGWLQAKENAQNKQIIEVRWSWDGKLWTPPFGLSRNLRWTAYNEEFRTDFIAFFSKIGVIRYSVSFGEQGAPEPNYKLP